MQAITIATAQFEHKNGDKQYNLSVIEQLAAKAAADGTQVIAFHECSITGYSFARKLSKEQMLAMAEYLPESPSVQQLKKIAATYHIVVLAGLFEKDAGDHIFKTYVCVDKNGLVASYRKLHPFINPHIEPGNELVVFDLLG